LKTPISQLVLYAVNSFFFLVLSFFFLPDSIVRVLGSAAGVALGVLGLKSLNPRETDSASFITRYHGWFVGALSVAAVLQAALLIIGFSNPCRIVTIPGSTISVDGKFLARTSDPIQSGDTNDIAPWLTPQENKYLLRWDTHEIKVTKKWYVTNDRSSEFVQNVSVSALHLWNPKEAFRRWNIKTTELTPLVKISYGIPSLEPRDDKPGDDELGQAVKSTIEEWDSAWTKALFGGAADPDRTDPYVVALEVVDGHVELQILDWTNHPMKALRTIHPVERRGTASNIDARLSSIWEDASEQLLAELAIQNKVKLKVPQETMQVAALTQTLASEVSNLSIPGEGPAPSPARSPATFPSPGVTAIPIRTPNPSPASFAPPVNESVKKLETIATSAADDNRLDIALAAQTALRQVQQQSPADARLAHDLQQANTAIGQAIKKKGAKGRVYIHIADESQRLPARTLQDVLVKNDGFAVIGIQNVGGRAHIPNTAEVRYFAFPNPPTAKQAAEEIVGTLKSGGIQADAIYIIPTERDKSESSDINTRFEIWFARDSFVSSK
jgi:hypothetical protein